MKVNDDCCDMFKALSVKTRVRILEALKKKGPIGTKKIAVIVGVTAAAVSQHLKVLKQAGLVRSERRGFRIPYHVDLDAMQNCQTKLVQVCTCESDAARGAPRVVMMRRTKPTLKELEVYKRRLEKELNSINERIEKAIQKKGR